MKQLFDQYGKMILALITVCIALVLLYGAGGSGGLIAKIGNTFYKDENGAYAWADTSTMRAKEMSALSDATVTLTGTGSGFLYTNTPYVPGTLFNITDAKGGTIQLYDTSKSEAERSFIEKVVDAYSGKDVTTSVITYGTGGDKDVRYLTFPENHKYYVYFRVYDKTSNRNQDLKTTISFRRAGIFNPDGTIILNWQQLKDQGYITVDDRGVLYGGTNKANLTGTFLMDDEVTAVAADSFAGCTGITKVSMPENVKSVGDHAFENCTGIQSVKMDNGLGIIDVSAFAGCNALTEVDLPNGINTVNAYAFENCTALFHVNYKDTGYEVRTDIENVMRNNSVTLHNTAFNSTALTGVQYASGIYAADKTYYSWQQLKDLGYLSVDGSGALTGGANKTGMSGTLVIDPEVTSLRNPKGDWANGTFYGCEQLTGIILPNTLTSMDVGALCDCKGLTSIIVPSGVTKLVQDNFSLCDNLETIALPDGLLSVGGQAFQSCYALKNITLPNTVEEIAYKAFQNCSSLTTFVLPDNIKRIGTQIFVNCNNLTQVTYAGVTYTSQTALIQALRDHNVTVADDAFAYAGLGQ